MRQFVFGIRPNESHYFRPAILTNPFLEIFKNNEKKNSNLTLKKIITIFHAITIILIK